MPFSSIIFSNILGLLGQNIQGLIFLILLFNNLPSILISPLPNNNKDDIFNCSSYHSKVGLSYNDILGLSQQCILSLTYTISISLLCFLINGTNSLKLSLV